MAGIRISDAGHFPFRASRISTKHQEPARGTATLESKADANAKAGGT